MSPLTRQLGDRVVHAVEAAQEASTCRSPRARSAPSPRLRGCRGRRPGSRGCRRTRRRRRCARIMRTSRCARGGRRDGFGPRPWGTAGAIGGLIVTIASRSGAAGAIAVPFITIEEGQQHQDRAGRSSPRRRAPGCRPTGRSGPEAPSTASVKPPGTSTTNATIPIISSGAVSPRARAMPMMVPVRIPGIASGRTWWTTTWRGEAPSPRAASRIEGGTAWIETRPVMMIVGSVIRARVTPPTTGADRGRSNTRRGSTARPSRPNTIEGTAARLLMFTSIQRRSSGSRGRTPRGRRRPRRRAERPSPGVDQQ